MLVKRPVLVLEKDVLIGFNEKNGQKGSDACLPIFIRSYSSRALRFNCLVILAMTCSMADSGSMTL